ncbi:MAG: bifunctional 5,10-methylenetetrahydrofolate dehydrogenase/5,10-methenyltetrahydrofolate cyclohydrolase [bacterium]|nr:bifunctional 5,10-methylenetetrahydrofolate dehydrogenase/5,10-methenyltetrahydrofolate cyclohydrolase [bacterium]
MATIVDGNRIASQILEELRIKNQELRKKGIVPRLSVFLVGENAASLSYVKIKMKKAQEIGIEVSLKKFPENIARGGLEQEIQKANNDKAVSGILVQLPLPASLNKEKILNVVDPAKDVDCLTEANKLKLVNMEDISFAPPAPAAILEILDFYKINLKNRNALLIGSGDLVGKPLSALLLKRKINFQIANTATDNLPELVSAADVIITGVGKAKLITGEMVKEGVVIIDAGTTGSEAGGISGDVDFESAAPKASLISPVPGGVGPVTVAMLLRNVVTAAHLTSS